MGSSRAREPVVKAGDLVEGRYRILSTLGEGGMGTVFLAEHTLIKRRVAMKILHPELATDADVIERFMNEARAAGTLGHPNIVESTDMGFTDDHVPYIVFEYLEGTLLTDEIYRVKGLPVRRAVRIAQQIASALHAAHNAGIIHRDLKSDNVFLTDKEDAADHVKVLDFGISRFLALDDEQTRKGMVMGTPEFMAPEQITAPASVDKRADIYALGVILYEMLTARRPFSDDADPRALMQRIVSTAPPPMQRLEIPHALNDMIMTKLLAKDREQRYPSMVDVEAALDAFTTRDDARLSRPTAAHAGDDLGRNSEVIPRPARSVETPWPMDPVIAIGKISLPPAPRPHRPWAPYVLAGAGVLVGALGLGYGMWAGKSEPKPSAAPAPIAPPRPAAAIPAPAAAPPPAPAKVDVSLDANVPDARVTFRRRVSPAPAALQIATSEIVEIVEISAPGYKTMRYWLTFDRPTHLNARLSKGKGFEEASDEATLVALGEVAAPAAVAAVPAPVAKPTTVAASRPTPVRRKLGRTAVEPVAAPVAPTAPTPPAAADPDPKSANDEPQPSFMAPPEPAPVAPTETAPAKREPAPEKVEPPKPD
jgi:serine/threonine protein kinase